MVTCDPDDNAGVLYCERPCLLVEVLSALTARIDREEKLRAYTGLASLQMYLLVAQDAPRVTVYRRANDWHAENYVGLETSLTLDCGPTWPPLALTLAEIYEDVALPD